MDVGMRGTNAAQDSRFKDKEAISIKTTKFPKNFSEKVDLRKINLSVLRPWIAQRVTELIKIEDDVVVEYAFGMLEDKDNPIPDPKKMQVGLVGFMDKHGAAAFMEKLWSLLLSAQSTVGGVPAEFIAAKKAELEQKQGDERKLQDTMIRSAQGRAQASDSFGRRDNGPSGLPPRPGGRPNDQDRPGPPFRRFSPPRDRDDGYRRGPPPRRFEDDRDRDRGYGGRGPAGRPRSRSPGRGYDYRRRSPSPSTRRRPPSPALRRRSPSPRRRSPSPMRQTSPSPPRRRRSPSPPRRKRSPSPPRRRRSPSPRRREHSITPPLRAGRSPPRERGREPMREGTPPMPSPSPSPSPPPQRKGNRIRSRSRTPTPKHSRSRSRSTSRSRSPTVTPPRRRAASPPSSKQRARSVSRSPSPKRYREDDEDGMIKKGRGRFTVEDEDSAPKKKLDGPLAKSRWA